MSLSTLTVYLSRLTVYLSTLTAYLSLNITVAEVALSHHKGSRSVRYDWLAHGHVTSACGYHVVHRRVSGGLQRSLSNDKYVYIC